MSFASCAVVLMAPPPFGAGGILGAPGGAFAPLGSLAASLLAAALLAGMIYMLVRPYKEATKLSVK